MARRGYQPEAGWRRRKLDCWRAAGGKCAKCGKRVSLAESEADHVHAIADGGGKSGRLQTLCKPCHKAKSRDERARRRQVRNVLNNPFWKIHAEIGRRLDEFLASESRRE